MLRPLIRSANTGPDVLMVMSSGYFISLMFGDDVSRFYYDYHAYIERYCSVHFEFLSDKFCMFIVHVKIDIIIRTSFHSTGAVAVNTKRTVSDTLKKSYCEFSNDIQGEAKVRLQLTLRHFAFIYIHYICILDILHWTINLSCAQNIDHQPCNNLHICPKYSDTQYTTNSDLHQFH